MASGRMLQNRVSKSNKLASLSSDTARLLYTWMLSHLDVNGNFYADPVMVNNIVFCRLGHSVKVVSGCLDELEAVGLIVRYKIDDEIYLNYPDFQEKQPKLNAYKEGKPDIPILTQESRITNACVTPAQEKRREVKRREVKTTKREEPKPGFEDFWIKYPRKVNRTEAIQAWNKANIPSMEFILNAIDRQKQSEQWNADGGKYIPYPSSWLNKERWHDELPIAGGGNGRGLGVGGNRLPKEYQPEPMPEISDEERKRNLDKLKTLSFLGGKG